MRFVLRSSVSAGVVLLLSACGSATTADGGTSEKTGRTSSAVQGGKLATTQTFAVGVFGRGLCSGTLIAPNLVITARHCVEVEPSSAQSGCEDGVVLDASKMRVTTAAAFGQQGPWRQAVRVLTGPKVDGCSPDVALVQLEENIPASEAKPATPAVDKAFTSRKHFVEAVTAIGYGLDDQGKAGQRRIRENIQVLCVPGDTKFDCGPQDDDYVRDFEFVAAEGACQGDSGGGLYDQESFDKNAPTVVGVVSRGPVDDKGICGPGAYVRVDKFVGFIVAAARVAAKEGSYPVPAWANDGEEPVTETPATEPAPEPAVTSAAGAPKTMTTTTTGCSAAPIGGNAGRNRTGLGLALGLGLVAARLRRRSSRA